VREVRRAIESRLGSPETVDWMPLLRDCDNQFLYATLDVARAPASLAREAGEVLAPFGWRAVLHARKLYALPQALCKGAAARYVAMRLAAERIMAAGDSELDIELLEAADDRWCPAGADVVSHHRLPSGTHVTRSPHVQGGTEIADLAVDYMRAHER
jgi:hypothetical protein